MIFGFRLKPSYLLILSITIYSVSLSYLMTRGERLLGHDSFFYRNLALKFSTHWPEHLGDHFAFGYPAVVGQLIKLGLDPFISACLVSALSWTALVWVYCKLTRFDIDAESRHRKAIVIFAAASAPGVFLLATSVMAEMLFSLVVGLQILALARGTLIASSIVGPILIVLSFCVRYVGVFSLISAAWYTLLIYHREGRYKLFFASAAGITVAALAVIALLYHNYLRTGYWSGGERTRGADSLIDVFEHAADFGWGFSGLWLGQAFRILESFPILYLSLGLAKIVVLIAYGGFLISRRTSPMFTAAGVSIIVYIVSLILMRSISQFDELFSSRFAMPVLIPILASVACASKRRHTGVIVLLSSAVIFVGLVQVVRGVSHQTFVEVRSAADIIRESSQPRGSVLAIGQASRIAAYLDGPVDFAQSPPTLLRAEDYRWVLVASKSLDRQGTIRVYEEAALSFSSQLAAIGFRVVVKTDDYILYVRE